MVNRSNPLWKVKAWAVLSSCYHNLAKYKRSEHAARQALTIAEQNGFAHEAIQALANLDEALRMQLDLEFLLNARPIIGKVKVLLLVMRFLFDGRKLAIWAQSAESLPIRQANSAAILEHRIRLFEIVQRFLLQLGGRRIANRLLAKRWDRIRQESHEVGYAAGIANALKCLSRVQGHRDHIEVANTVDGINVVSAQQVFDLIGHRTGLALILRNQADTLVSEGLGDRAVGLYEQVATIAEDLGNASLELKALLGLQSCNRTIDVHRLIILADSIENDAPEAIRAAILRKVTG